MCILDHYNGRINHRAYSDCDAAKTHNIRGNPDVIHADKGYDNGYGQGQNNHKGTGQVKEEYSAYNAYNDRKVNDFMLQVTDRTVYQIRPVIRCDNFNSIRQRRLDLLFDLLLDALDDAEDILSEADNTIPPATSPFPLRSASPLRISGPSWT